MRILHVAARPERPPLLAAQFQPLVLALAGLCLLLLTVLLAVLLRRRCNRYSDVTGGVSRRVTSLVTG